MGKIICIDAGHGEMSSLNHIGDPGAVNGKLYESIANLNIAIKLGKMLENKGYKVIYTRSNGKFVSLSKRCSIANAANADAFISIHLNSSENKSARGIETWMYPTKDALTFRLAASIQKNLIDETGAKDRGVKESNTLYVLKQTKMAAVLIECGFISNDAESKKLFQDSYQSVIAKSICDAIVANVY